jgi:pentatricopeptide repeat protein
MAFRARDSLARSILTPGGPVVPPNNLAQLLTTFATLKAEGRKPTAAAYNTLIKEAANYGTRRGSNAQAGEFSLGFEIALGAMRDAEAGGIELGIEALNELLRFSVVHPEILPSLLLEFAKRQVSTVETYDTLAAHALLPGRVEEVVMILIEMLEQNMAPSKAIVRSTIRLLCEWGMSRLALDLVHRIQEVPGQGQVASESWVQILMAAADQQDLPTVEAAWDRVVNVKAYTPDEGLILAVLAVAARWGKPTLATRALAALSDIGVSKKEHHLTPLIEAFCRDGRVPDAIEAVGLIRESGITPSLMTVRPIVDVLRTAEIIDQAFYCLEDRAKEGKAVDVAVFNALIQASAKTGDLQRARATQLAAPELGVTPDVETFNMVLTACAATKHKDLAQTVLSEMEKAGYAPTASTYEAMIRLALSQPEYEDAFYYLEKMKADGIKPSRMIYKQIGMKCVSNNDKRYSLVADEMESIGYGNPDFAVELERKRARQARGRERDGQRRERGQKPSFQERGDNEKREARNARTRERQPEPAAAQ